MKDNQVSKSQAKLTSGRKESLSWEARRERVSAWTSWVSEEGACLSCSQAELRVGCMLQKTGENGEVELPSCLLCGTQKIPERKQLPSILEKASNSRHLIPTAQCEQQWWNN